MPGLIGAIATSVLTYYGWSKAEPSKPPASDPSAPSLQTRPFWSTYAASGAQGLPLSKNFRELAAGYRSWVYSCVRAISFRVAMLPLSLMLIETDAEGGTTESPVPAHPFLDMVWRPNRFLSRMELWLTTLNHLDLTGNAYWLVLYDKLRIPREIWPLMPQYMRVIPDAVNFLKGYVYTLTTPPIRFELDSPEYRVVHFKYPNPVSPYYGMGPLEAQAYAYDIDLYLQVYQRNFFSEGARPDFVMETDQRITKDDAEMVWALWDERHKGVAKSWRPGILGMGLKAKPLQVSNRDLAFAALADYSRDQILAAFGVPAAKLGLVVDVNRANADAADVTFNREAVLPRITLIEERIEADLLSAYPGQSPALWLETDFENPVPTDREMELRERELYLKNGVVVINEVREEIGKEEVPWGAVPIMPAGMLPLGEAPAPTEPTPEPTPAPAPSTPPEEPTQADAATREAFRTKRWEVFVARTESEEERVIPKIRGLFGEQEKRVRAKVEAVAPKALVYFTGWSTKKVRGHLEHPPTKAPDWIAEVLAVLDMDADAWTTLLADHLTSVVDTHGTDAVAEIGAGVWDLYDPTITKWLKAHAAERMQDVQQVTKKKVRAALIQGIENGEGTADLVKRITAVFEGCSTTRARNIARTETGTAANYGLLQGWKQTGVVETKEWLSARDSRVRDTHQEADGQSVPLTEDFHVGDGHGPAPGHIGLPEEDCGCRCTMLAGLSKSAKAKDAKTPKA